MPFLLAWHSRMLVQIAFWPVFLPTGFLKLPWFTNKLKCNIVEIAHLPFIHGKYPNNNLTETLQNSTDKRFVNNCVMGGWKLQYLPWLSIIANAPTDTHPTSSVVMITCCFASLSSLQNSFNAQTDFKDSWNSPNWRPWTTFFVFFLGLLVLFDKNLDVEWKNKWEIYSNAVNYADLKSQVFWDHIHCYTS